MADGGPLIVFDVNETLLDIDALEPMFDRIFAVKGVMREWFAQLILYSQSLSLTGHYVPFGGLGAGVLRMLGQIHQATITDGDVSELNDQIAHLPVHSDVPAGLLRLKAAGCTLVTLTNGRGGTVPEPLDQAGLKPLFARSFTIDTVRRFKPAPATYQMVTSAMNFAPSETWLVAAHSWDIIGAMSCGWNAALMTRGINAPLVLEGVPQPICVTRDLAETADVILSTLGMPPDGR